MNNRLKDLFEVKDENFANFLNVTYPSSIENIDGFNMVNASKDGAVFNETELDLSLWKIKDLSGIEAFSNLERLDVSCNYQLENIPYFPKLRYLNIKDTSIVFIPYEVLIRLERNVATTVLDLFKNYNRLFTLGESSIIRKILPLLHYFEMTRLKNSSH